MSQFNIEVIDVEYADIPKKNGKGTYGKLTVTHKTDEGKVEAKAVMDFATPSEAFERLKKATKGDRFAVSREKDANGYWVWTGVDTQVAGPKAATAPAARPSYETSEERAARQVYIIKQSSIASAVAFYQGKDVLPEKVLETAEKFKQYVLGEGVQHMEDDIPF